MKLDAKMIVAALLLKWISMKATFRKMTKSFLRVRLVVNTHLWFICSHLRYIWLELNIEEGMSMEERLQISKKIP